MTSAQQNPSRTPNSGSASRRPPRSPSGRAGGDLHSTEGQGVPGDRMGWTGTGDKLAAEHAEPSAHEALAISTATAVPSGAIPPC